ncbi:phosphomevalonate kinase [Actinomyces sp. 186855]|uniref:phosphomevalonate kinase n=1 Tax=Actinomyces sp. 186855 TaxID=2761164 RepID=UPI00202E6B99|nr:phosphomevalonate kinase [Actinomyces sp. 186855]
MNRSVTRQAPGKLYVAGEYAVVESGHSALLVAVDRFLTVTAATAAGPRARVSSALYDGGERTWERDARGLAVPSTGEVDYVISALRVVEELVRERGREPDMVHLDVISELDDASGRKLGLGSSAAVTVATVRAVAGFHGLDLSDLDVLKMALLASDAVEPVGSGGDLAASALTGWVLYSSPDRQWLRGQRRGCGVGALLAARWPGLAVRRMPQADGIDLLVGWTGEPASTASLVSHVKSRLPAGPPPAGPSTCAATGPADPGTSAPAVPAAGSGHVTSYEQFLAASEACLAGLVTALEAGDLAGVRRQVGGHRALLAELSRMSGVVIETPGLSRLVEIACAHGAAAKSSGAGGGDCGIALHGPATSTAALRAAWAEAGIVPLDLAVFTRSEEAS